MTKDSTLHIGIQLRGPAWVQEMRRRKDEAAAAIVAEVRLPPRDVIPETEYQGSAPMVEDPQQQGLHLLAGAGDLDEANRMLQEAGLQSDGAGDEPPRQRQRIG
eukprot:scaffold122888_cov13-Tisochrysis_lutea.AAC.1